MSHEYFVIFLLKMKLLKIIKKNKDAEVMVCQEIRDRHEEDIFIKIKKLLKKNENY